MPKWVTEAEVITQRQTARDVYVMTVAAPQIAADALPGNFIMVRAGDGDAHLLRRPLGIADADLTKGTISLIYKVIGEGTKKLTALKSGENVSVLGALGNSFSLSFKKPLLVGGGIGLAPLLYFAKCAEGADVVMGGRSAADMFWTTLFRPYVQNMFVATDDGTMGTRGFAVDLLPQLLQKSEYDGLLVVGPMVMMEKAAHIAAEYDVPCQVSLENRMGCGLGACLSCAVKTVDGVPKKVCTDGPVFWAREVWA